MKKILILLAVIIIILSALYFSKNKNENKIEIKKEVETVVNNKEETEETVQEENTTTEETEVSEKAEEEKEEVAETDTNQETVNLEVSRVKKDCGDKKCLQVKEENGEWKILKTDISGFEYKDGYYYVLKVEKTETENTEEYKLVEIEKEIKPKN